MHIDNMPSLILDGTRWTRFWWYTTISGWPDTEIDVLGGLFPYACAYKLLIQ